ncbi:MAG: hypothetical protein JXR05_01125 [Flavobacteriaceae bacterium]
MLKRTILVFTFLLTLIAHSQEKSEGLRIFIDCNRCDNQYIRQNLGNVEFVRDQNLAEVHLFFTTQRNGSGGTEYVVDFIGRETFANLKDQLTFNTNANMTRDEVRNLTLKYIKIGLVRYWAKAGKLDGIDIYVQNKPKLEEDKEEQVEDPWNFWVYRIGANGNFSGQETRRNSRINTNISARRVTEKNKLFIRVGYNENKTVIDFDGEETTTIRHSKNFNINDAISINDHWSIGAFGSLRSSVFSNLDFSWSFRPAIEYNFFNYAESAKKQITISYNNGVRFNDYIELTVFGKNEEYLWEHRLALGASINQKWGSLSGQASFDQFLQDLTLNSLNFRINANVRVFKGFNFNAGARYSIINNQVNLSAGGVTLEDLLLNQQQLPSSFNYSLNIGFNYTFGSIYNTIVNPRFGF